MVEALRQYHGARAAARGGALADFTRDRAIDLHGRGYGPFHTDYLRDLALRFDRAADLVERGAA